LIRGGVAASIAANTVTRSNLIQQASNPAGKQASCVTGLKLELSADRRTIVKNPEKSWLKPQK